MKMKNLIKEVKKEEEKISFAIGWMKAEKTWR